jgi:hypothetical protein
MARLANVVHLTDDKGQAHAFGPGDEVPAWAESLITNPKAWAEAPDDRVSRLTQPPVTTPKRATARRKAVPSAPVHDD